MSGVSKAEEEKKLPATKKPDMEYMEKMIPGGSFRCRYDDYWTLIDANEGLYRFIGYTAGEIRDKYQNRLIELIHPDDRAALSERIAGQLKRGTTVISELRIICGDGSEKWGWINAELMLNQNSEPLFYCIFIDIHEWKNAQEKLAESEQRYAYILSQTRDVIFEWNFQTKEIFHSPNFVDRFGYAAPTQNFPQSVVEQGMVFSGDVEEFLELYHRYEQGAKSVNVEFRIRDAGGNYVWCRSRSSGIYDSQGRLLKVLGMLYDIDHDKKELNQVTEQARRDPLTGLYNKEATEERITSYLECQREPALFMVIDVDNFKNVNDTLGHIYGDAVLSDISSRLNSLFRSSDVIGRVGGDEFVVFLPGIREERDARRRIENAAEVFHRTYNNGKIIYHLSGSIGAARFPEDGSTYLELFENADRAMYYAKKHGKNQYALYRAIEHREEGKGYTPHPCLRTDEKPLLELGGELSDLAKAALASGEAAEDADWQAGAADIAGVPSPETAAQEAAAARASAGEGAGRRTIIWQAGTALPSGEEDGMEELSRRIAREREWISVALEYAKISVWEYDIPEERVNSIGNFGHFHQLPERLEDVPESLIARGYVHPESVGEFRRLYQSIKDGAASASAEIHCQDGPEGRDWWEKVTYTTCFDQGGRPERAIGIGENITGQKEAESRYQQELNLRRQSMADVIAACRVNLTQERVEYLQSSGREYDFGEMTYPQMVEIVLGTMDNAEDRAKYKAAFSGEALRKSWLAGEKNIVQEYRRKDKQGQLIWVRAAMSLVREGKDGELYGYGLIRDIDDRKKIELSLRQRAERDSVTGVYNRDTFREIVERAVEQCKRQNKSYALLFVDVDSAARGAPGKGRAFDRNELLKKARGILRKAFGSGAIIGRTGSDQFIVYIGDNPLPEEVRRQAEETLRAASRAYPPLAGEAALSLSLGAAFHGGGAEELDQVYEWIKAAAGQAKKAGPNQFVIYDQRLEEQRPEERRTEGWLSAPRREMLERALDVIAKEEAKLNYLRLHDSLTGLYNRQRYLEYKGELREEGLISLGVASFDINGLKGLNSRYGYDYGDEIVKLVADTLREGLGSRGQIYRFSGDEFLAVCENITRDAFVKAVKGIQRKADEMVPGSLSAGYAWADRDINLDVMARHADERMILAKQDYRQNLDKATKSYDPALLRELMSYIRRGCFSMFLQPKAEAREGRIIGAEALVRFSHPKYGLIQPVKFVPQLEESGSIRYIDLFMFEEVCRTLKKWRDQGFRPLAVSLNFSRATMLTENLIQTMEEIYSKYRPPRELIEIEITESIGEVERETVAQIGRRIVAAGFRLSLDDFGAKYSNISVLSAMDLHVVKLDKSLINDLTTNAATRVIVSNFIKTCRELKIEIVAEGVETREQFELLKAMDCDLAQGYYFNKPIPLADFERKYLERPGRE